MKNDKVDERVVKLELDNSDFEQKSKESMKTIDKLDKKLKFEDVEDSIKKIEFQFSKMEIVAIAAISNITNRVINLGIQVVKSLSVDNISVGWSKFGDKATSVATMAAQAIRVAGKELTTQEEKLEAINEQLDRLNWFTDETSYSFTDMVSNIGKFTAAGVDLDKSVDAMMGIANWAALSGQNAATASRAMYQLAQALGKGSVQLIDYRSIQNANMDTQEFRQTVLDTAAAMGELTKEGNNFITKTGKKFTKNQFAEFLSEKWFTSDVLVQSLGKYSAAIEKIYNISQETGMTASEVISRYGDELDEFGLKAFKAAQEARTFTDVLNSIKDAVSTGWMKVAEKMFGGYEESVKTWTELANRLYDVFTEQVFYIEDVLKAAEKLDFREDLFKIVDSEELKEEQGALWNIIDAIEYLSDTIKSAWNTIFPKSQFEEYNDQVNEVGSSVKRLAETFRKYTLQLANTIKNSETLKSLFTGIFGVLGGLIYVLKAIRFIIDPILYSIKEVITLVYTKLSDIVGDTSKLASFIGVLESAAMRLNKTIQSLMEIINPAGLLNRLYNYIVDLFDAINETKPLETLAGWINNIYSAIEKFLIDDGVLEGILNSVISLISVLGKVIIRIVKILNKTVIPLGKKLVEIGEKLVEIILDIVSSIVNLTTTAATNISGLFSDIFGEFNPVGVLSSLSNFLTGIIDSFENFKKKIADLDFDDNKDGNPLVDLVIGLIKLIEGAINLLSPMISILARILAGIGNLLTKVGEMLQDFFDHVTGVAEAAASLTTIIISGAVIIVALKFTLWIIETLRVWMNPLATLLQSLADVCDGIWSFLNKKGLAVLIKSIGDALLEISIAILLISYIDWKKAWPGVVALGGIAALIMAFTVIVTKISKVTISTGKKITGLKDGLFSLMSAMRDVIKGVSKNLVFLSLGKLVKSIATSMILLSAAFLLMSKLDWESVKKGLAIMAAYFGGFIATYATIMLLSKKVKKGTNIKKLVGSFWTFSGVAVAILSISKAITRMATIADDKKMWSAIGGIVAVIIALVGSLTLLNKLSSNGSRTVLASAAELTALSIALGLMIAPILILGALPIDTVWKGFAAIASLTALIVTATAVMTKFSSKISISAIFALVAMSAALLAFTTSVAMLGAFSWEHIGKGLVGVAALLVMFAGVMIALKYATKGMNFKKGLSILLESVGIVSALVAFAIVCSALGAVPILFGIKGLIAISLLLLAFTLTIKAINKMKNVIDWKAGISVLLQCVGMSIAMISFAGAMAILGAVFTAFPTSQLWKVAIAFTTIVAIMAAVTSAIYFINKGVRSSDISTGVSIILQLVGLSAALLAFAATMWILALFPWNTIWYVPLALVGVMAAFMGALIGINRLAGAPQKSTSILFQLIGLSAALLVFAASMWILAIYPWNTMWYVPLVIAGVLAAFMGLIIGINRLAGSSSDAKGALFQLIGLSTALLAFAASMWLLALYPWSSFWYVPIIVAGIMAAFMGALIGINKLAGESKNAIGNIILLGGISVALIAFAGAMIMMSSIPWETILTATLMMVLVIATIVGAMFVINAIGENGPMSLILLAGALMILSISMIAFGAAASLLGSTGMKNVAKALLVMCAALAVLSTVAFIISKAGVDMVLTTLAIAIILVGIGMLATALAMGEFNDHFVEILNNIKDNAPLIGEAFSAMLQAARQALPDLFALIGDFVSGILQLIRDKTPEFFETVKVLVHGVLDLIRDIAPDLIHTVGYLINCLADNADYILTGLFRLLIIFLDKLATYIPVIVNRLVEILARLIVALADSLMTLFYAIEYLTVKLFELLLRALPNVWDQCTQWMPDGLRTVLGWIFGFEELRWLADRVGGLANNVKRDLENEMANNHIDLAEVFGVDGQNAADGYAQGIAENSDKSIEAAAGMAEGAQEAIAEAQDSHSPSKKTYELGLYAVEGYAEGVEENTAIVKEAIENMVITSLADIQSILDAEMDENPIVIRPVLDLSGIQGQASSIQSIMGTVGNVDVASSTAETVSRSMPNKASGVNEVSKNQNGSTTNNNYSDSYNVTFNVTSDDPEEIAKQVDEQLQKMRINRRLAKGGV